MYYVGIDVAKEKHYVCVLDDTKATPQKLTKIFRHIKGNNFNDDGVPLEGKRLSY